MKKILLLSILFLSYKSFCQVSQGVFNLSSHGYNYTVICDTIPSGNGVNLCNNRIEFIVSADTARWVIFLYDTNRIYSYTPDYGYQYLKPVKWTTGWGLNAYYISPGFGPDTLTLFNVPANDEFSVVSNLNYITSNQQYLQNGWFPVSSCQDVSSGITEDSITGLGCNKAYTFKFDYDTTLYVNKYYSKWIWWINSNVSQKLTSTTDSITYTSLPNGVDTLHCIAQSQYYNDTITLPVDLNFCSNDSNDNYISMDSSKINSCDTSYTFKYSVQSWASSYIKLTASDTVWFWWFSPTNGYVSISDSITIDSAIAGRYGEYDTIYCWGVLPYPTDTITLIFKDNLCKDTVKNASSGLNMVTDNKFKVFVYNGILYLSEHGGVTVQVSDLLGRYTIYNMSSNELVLPEEFGIIRIFKDNIPVSTLKFVNVQ